MTLAWVYAHHGEALEAELMTEYGVELEEPDEEASSTLRKLWVYYDQLPAVNRISREILEIKPAENVWGSMEALLADLIDAVLENSYILAQANSKGKVKPPKAYPRPEYGKKAAEKLDKTPKRNRLPGAVTYIPKTPEVNEVGRSG